MRRISSSVHNVDLICELFCVNDYNLKKMKKNKKLLKFGENENYCNFVAHEIYIKKNKNFGIKKRKNMKKNYEL